MRTLLIPAELVLLLGLAACGGEEGDHPGHGVVQSVDAAARQVTIDHEDIPGLMEGMTMTFEVGDPSLLEGLAPGQEVDFRVRKEGDRYLVTAIQPAL